MTVGIDAINFYTPQTYLPIESLAKARNIEFAKLNKGLGLEGMAICDINEDAATMGANAVIKIIEAEKINLEDIGLTHFFTKSEYKKLLKGCSIINPCESVYELPKVEANQRGYDHYNHAMWIVYAVK